MLLAVLTAGTAAAVERQFSYPEPDAMTDNYGNRKAEVYDVAIRLNNPALIGAKVTGVTVPFPESLTNFKDAKAWIATELKLENKKNAPDIACVDATVGDDKVMTATFAEPYTITADGLYVGYSITITKATTDGDQFPNPVAECVNPDGLYVHSSRTDLKWTSLADANYSSSLVVNIDGDFPETGAAVARVPEVRSAISDTEVTFPVYVANLGVNEISSLSLNVSVNGAEPVEYAATLDAPLTAKFATEQVVSLTIPNAAETFSIDVSVAKVNGQAAQPNEAVSSKVYVLNFVPVMRPLMEEYTGLWCSWCPRGYVAMEEMSELYPEDFVCVSYHDGDIMQYVTEFPSMPSGYPSAFLNRGGEIDPYYGTADDGFGMRDEWLALKAEEAEADIDVEIESVADGKVVCTATTYFTSDVKGSDYRVNYVLVGDGFKTVRVYDSEGNLDKKSSVILEQANNYTAIEPLDDSPLWDLFYDKGPAVDNLVFNDVAMAISTPADEEALPAEIKPGEPVKVSHTFDYNNIVNAMEERNILPSDGKIHCVAVLLTADGQFVNCNKSAAFAAPTTGIHDVLTDGSATVTDTEWFDMQGRRVANPDNGLYLRRDRLSDGTTRTVKVAL